MRKSKLEELKSYIEELKTIRVIESKKINNGFLSINSSKFLLNNGKIIVREEILKNNRSGSSVIVLPVTKVFNTVLIVEPRVFTNNTVSVELPAGYIDEGELPVVSAARELKEETGYSSNKIKEIAQFYQDQGCSRALNHSFIAFECEKTEEQKLDKDEFIRLFECTYEEALELMEMGYINDGNSIITLEKSKKYLMR